MKLFEIKVERVLEDGHFAGYEAIGFVINEEKAYEVANKWVEEHMVSDWWMRYGKNDDGRINVKVEYKGEIIE